MFPSLFGNTEDEEENQSTANETPLVEHEGFASIGDIIPKLERVLTDSVEAQVKIGKAVPWIKDGLEVLDIGVSRKRNGAANFNDSHGHQAEVTVEGEVVVGGNKFAELFATLHESTESEDYNGLNIL